MNQKSNQPALEPASYSENEGKNRYRPGLPWVKIGVLLAVAATVFGIYQWRQRAAADEIREDLVALQQEKIMPLLFELQSVRATAELLTLTQRQDAANRVADPTFKVSSLHDKNVVYLRVNLQEVRNVKSLRNAISAQTEDAIGACLGLRLQTLGTLTDVDEVLQPGWLSDAEYTNDVLRMQIRREQLLRAVREEIPKIRKRLPVDYFLLIVVQGADRAKDPVDVYAWELASKKKVLQMRTEPIGKLISVRNRLAGKAGAARPENNDEKDAALAADCSLAAQIKGALGEATPTPQE